jgi:uncharacterized membrane protein YeaQ/YmgE (transglycosylase-associated protein family)
MPILSSLGHSRQPTDHVGESKCLQIFIVHSVDLDGCSGTPSQILIKPRERLYPEGHMIHGIIWWIVVGLIAGWAAGKIMKGGGYGVIADILLGIVGGILGGWVIGLLGLGTGGLIWSILIAILGAVVLIWITRLIKKEA